MSDIGRIKALLRHHGLHEEDCLTSKLDLACTCLLSEDLFDLEKDPPKYVDGYETADPPPKAERSRRHIYSDGRVREWVSERGGPWTEVERMR